MTKFIVLVVLACAACRLLFGKWPWQWLSGKPHRRHEIEQARRQLKVPADATRQDIINAHRRIIAEVHPDRGGNSERAHEVNKARDLLLNNLSTESRESRT